MSLLISFDEILNQIVSTVEKLSPEEQKRVLLRLQKGELTATAKRLSKSVRKNSNTAQQTVAAVKKWKKTA